jgi:hypothetical protein
MTDSAKQLSRGFVMKKRLSLVFLALLVVFAFFSCDLWYAIFGDPIVGTWKVTAETINGTAIPIGSSGVDVTMTIANDKSIAMSGTVMGAPATGTGTWSRSDITYTLLFPGMGTGGSTFTETGTLSSDNKTLTLTISATGITSGSVTCTRQ